MKKIYIIIVLIFSTILGYAQQFMSIDNYGNIFINNHLNQTEPWFEPDTVFFINYYLPDNSEDIDSNISKSVFLYDEVGRLISRINHTQFSYYTQNLELISISTVSMDTFIYENNLLAKMEYYYWDYTSSYGDSIWTKSSYVCYFEYNSEQKLIKISSGEENGAIWNTYEFNYNDVGKIDRQTFYNGYSTESFSYTYDDFGLLKVIFSYIQYDSDDGESFIREINDYNNYNQLTTIHSQYNLLGTWISQLAMFYDYATPDDRSPMIYRNNEDTLLQYTYDTHQNCIEVDLNDNYYYYDEGFYYNNGMAFYNKLFTRECFSDVDKLRVHYKQIRGNAKTEMSKNSTSDLTLFPNPATNFVELRITNDKLQINEVEVYDMMGKRVDTHDHAFLQQSATINVSELASGTYFVRVTTSDGNLVTKKLVKK